LRLQREKVRIYALARELDMESKDLLELCRQHGIDVRNQLSSLEPEQRDQIEQLVRKGGGTATAAPPRPAAPPALNVPPSRVPDLTSRRPATLPPSAPRREEPPAPAAPAAPAAKADVPPPAAAPAPAPPAPAAPPVPPSARPAAEAPRPPQAPAAGPRPPEGPAAPRPPQGPSVARPPAAGGTPVRNLNTPRPGGPRPVPRPVPRPPMGGNFRIAPPPSLKPRPSEPPKPAAPAGPKKLANIEDLVKPGGAFRIEDVGKHVVPKTPGGVVAPVDDEEEEGKGKGAKGGTKRPGHVSGRDERHKARAERQAKRRESGSDLRGGATALADDEESRRSRIGRLRKQKKAGPQPRKGKVPLETPITVRSLSEAMGVRSAELLLKLMNHGITNVTINSTLDPVMAEAFALENGCELDIKRPPDAEEKILADLKKPDDPAALKPRAPVVTVMGHVDHGKTSLLDRIRQSNVVATEAGGITQVIRAWRVVHKDAEGHEKPITFLDTPGHEAFTKMRARGANVTDIAVIVVAVDDGVMPQTEEAINHAKAAGVPIVVALNKVDLPNANLRKAEQQLYGLSLLPDNMGGEVPFVQTSAATGKGIDDLLENIALVAELQELKANPDKPASGTCLEAYLSEKEGVFATILVQDGTLHDGDVVVCGASYGRVRAMYDDQGRPVHEAGPSVPVRITGLDEVPNADDPFVVVPDLSVAREVAEKRRDKLQEAALVKRAPVQLESLTAAKITELKVILKAEARGSIEAIRKELEKLHHEEVRVRVLHAAIGGITESDVQLALTSPQDTLIVGFNVVPDDRARALADERGVQIRQYNIIYQLTDDIRSALEGKLKPREEVIHLGRAVVRETFKISRVGTIAGCYVTQGVIERNAKVRVIRSGVVIYPPADRTAGLESLKRFKEDVREVREGFECGLKIAGYDDVKVDDVIEAYRVEQVQRKLS
jgi:translation initiation factor IF-2